MSEGSDQEVGKINPIKEHRKLNSIIPFPSEIKSQEDGLLEAYLKNLTQAASLPLYEELPNEITSFAIDRYANWLFKLTDADSLKRERGAFIHLDVNKNRLIYPSNPFVGTSNETLSIAGEGKRFLPIVRIHTHPNRTCFSPTDLRRPISDSRFIAEMLSTKGKNYLLLRTEDSVLEDAEETIKKMDELTNLIMEDANRVGRILSVMVKNGIMPGDVAELILVKINEINLRELGSPFVQYYLTHYLTFEVAKTYKLGFYASQEEGVYKEVSGDGIEREMEEFRAKYLALVNKFFDEMENANK